LCVAWVFVAYLFWSIDGLLGHSDGSLVFCCSWRSSLLFQILQFLSEGHVRLFDLERTMEQGFTDTKNSFSRLKTNVYNYQIINDEWHASNALKPTHKTETAAVSARSGMKNFVHCDSGNVSRSGNWRRIWKYKESCPVRIDFISLLSCSRLMRSPCRLSVNPLY
jgi:hypothetical protein